MGAYELFVSVIVALFILCLFVPTVLHADELLQLESEEVEEAENMPKP